MRNYKMIVMDRNGASDEMVELLVTDVIPMIKAFKENEEICFIRVLRSYKGYGKMTTIYEWEVK